MLCHFVAGLAPPLDSAPTLVPVNVVAAVAAAGPSSTKSGPPGVPDPSALRRTHKQHQQVDIGNIFVGDKVCDETLPFLALVSLVAVFALTLLCALRRGQAKSAPKPAGELITAGNSSRLVWLDHAKVFALFLVFLGHVDTYCSDPLPTWIRSAHFFAGRQQLHIFFFVSGAVSRPEISAATVIRTFVALIAPIMLLQAWDKLLSHPCLTHWPNSALRLFYLYPFDHFLYALFMLRCLFCPLLGQLPTRSLVFAVLVIYLPNGLATVFIDSNDPQPEYKFESDPLRYAIVFMPSFFAGLVLRRNGMIERHVDAMRARPWLRLLPLALLTGLCTALAYDALPHRRWASDVWPRPECAAEPEPEPLIGPKLHVRSVKHWRGEGDGEADASAPRCWATLLWDLVNAPLQLGFAALYAYGSIGWLPTERVPLLTGAGTRTLVGYLVAINVSLERVGIQLILAYALHVGYSWDVLWAIVPYLALMVFALTSEVVHFVVWPLLTPTWLEWVVLRVAGLGSGPYATPTVHARYGGWKTWAPSFLLFTCACNALFRLDEATVKCGGSAPPVTRRV